MGNVPMAEFEHLVRRAALFSDEEVALEPNQHPFDERNLHPSLPRIVRSLFDDGYYAQATFEAFKFLDKVVAKYAKSRQSGYKLMMAAFNENDPKLKLTTLLSESEKDEQRGYQFMFAGSVVAIRNPRGHEFAVEDTLDRCLDHLSLASLLLRRLDEAGYRAVVS